MERISQLADNDTQSQQANTAVDANVDIERQVKQDTESVEDDENRERPARRHIFRWLGRVTNDGESFALRSATTTRGPLSSHGLALRTQAIKLLLHLPTDYPSEWRGILAFFSHVEKSFADLLVPEYEILWKILHRPPPSTTADCWYWCFAVIEAFQALDNADRGIERAYDQLLRKLNVAPEDITTKESQQIIRAMFAVLCWTSATLNPILGNKAVSLATNPVDSDEVQSLRLEAKNSSKIYHTDDIDRPLSKMFGYFRTRAQEDWDLDHPRANIGAQGNGGGSNHMLYESSLKYSSLATIGRVRLVWVDTLTAHLAFDRPNRTLSIFRFPSFCVAQVLYSNNVKVLQNVTSTLLSSNYYSDFVEEKSALYREVLLSYRLLFGQSASSRKLFTQLHGQSFKRASTTYGHHILPNYHNSANSWGDATADEIDPFLYTICTTPLNSHLRYSHIIRGGDSSTLLPSGIFPSSALDSNGQFQESDTYSGRDDFPVFGPRLLALQRYNMRQQPSRIRDFWRDRRNPLQWYTFWAVLWIGGASIILAVLQLVVGIVQIYYTVRP